MFERQQDIKTRDIVRKEIGPFIDPTEMRHYNYYELHTALLVSSWVNFSLFSQRINAKSF